MANLNTFTEGMPDDCKTVGTTANIAIGSIVAVSAGGRRLLGG